MKHVVWGYVDLLYISRVVIVRISRIRGCEVVDRRASSCERWLGSTICGMDIRAVDSRMERSVVCATFDNPHRAW